MNDQTIHELEEVIQRNPEDARAYSDRGRIYFEKGNYNQAVTDYDKAIELDPENTDFYVHRGIIYFFKGDYVRAIADYNRAIELAPEYTLAYMHRGSAYYDKGNYDRAIEDYDHAVRLCPYETEVDRAFANWVLVGNLEEVIKRLENIIIDFHEKCPNCYYYYTGVRALFTNDRLSARRCFKIALKLGYADREKAEQHLENLKK